ncbi:Rv3235 family protein [Mycolicibacterium pulveris]|uniref:Rv3235 family protein n=1 Tax=Mycolicibacterium pulveris TaxID=36813 RepID=UPI003CEB4E08
MTTARTPSVDAPPALVSPVIDYEPPPAGQPACVLPSHHTLRRHTPRRLRAASVAEPRETAPPRDAIVFADAALRRVLEIIDRRRPVAQLRPILAPELTDIVVAMARASHTATRHDDRGTAATLQRVRLRMVDDISGAPAAEVFGTYTRGRRVRALAARIALTAGRWRIVAIQIG